jgi:hypothetical protein
MSIDDGVEDKDSQSVTFRRDKCKEEFSHAKQSMRRVKCYADAAARSGMGLAEACTHLAMVFMNQNSAQW